MADNEVVYAYFDGDNIGSRLELLLMDDLAAEASQYSQSVSDALARIRDMLDSAAGVRVVLAGGDDLLACWAVGDLSRSHIEGIQKVFEQVCGQSLSAGIGSSPRAAAINLRRAKLMGKSTIVTAPGVI